MSDKKSEKSAYDYAELGGLRISLMNVKVKNDKGDEAIIAWIENRVNELNNKQYKQLKISKDYNYGTTN